MSHVSLVKAAILLGVATSVVSGQELRLNSADNEVAGPRTELLDLDGGLRLGEPPSAAESPPASLSATPAKEANDEPPAAPVNEVVAQKAPVERDAAHAQESLLPVRELEGEPVQRGPIHEAFASPVQQAPQPRQVVRKAPPANVEEIPPELGADSTNMDWIPGYWAWDEQANQYVWVSGVWRKIPKGRSWVPGRWEPATGGYQWVPGGWLPLGAEDERVQRDVQPLPPESLEKGPTSPAPSNEHFWIPGTWKQSANAQYVWRPGYWARSHQNWVWVPDHYLWDPAGCVYVPGYWDYTWERRGTLYAPCTFGTVRGARIAYRPSRVIDANQWLLSLWIGPRAGGYYFGDYYDYVSLGYSPWYQYYGRNRAYYDPLYTYYRWQFPATYGFGLYGYLDQLHLYYGINSGLRPSIGFRSYQQQRYRGLGSLYGDVYRLSRMANFDYNDYRRRGRYYDDYFDRRRYDGERRHSSSSFRQRSPNQSRSERRLIGYANGAPLYSDERTGRIKRAEIGLSRGRDYNASDRARDRLRQLEAAQDRARVNKLGPVRQPVYRPSSDNPRAGAARPNRDSRQGPGPTRRSGGVRQGSTGRSSGSPSSLRSPSTLRSPSSSRGRNPSTGTLRPTSPAPRANPINRPAVRTPNPRGPVRSSSGGPVRSGRQVNRSTSSQIQRATPRANSRPAPQPTARSASPRSSTRSTGPGFSISGMKNARNRADVQRQRDAMQNLIRERKGRK